MYWYIDRFLRTMSHWVDGMTTTQWFIALVVVLAVGSIFLRGFGSRTNY